MPARPQRERGNRSATGNSVSPEDSLILSIRKAATEAECRCWNHFSFVSKPKVTSPFCFLQGRPATGRHCLESSPFGVGALPITTDLRPYPTKWTLNAQFQGKRPLARFGFPPEFCGSPCPQIGRAHV